MVLLAYVEIMNARGAGGSGVVVMVYATTTAPTTHVKSLAYIRGAHTHSVRFSHSKRTFDRRNYKHLIAVTNIFYRNSDQTRLIYCTCILYTKHIHFCWMCFNLHTAIVSASASVVPHSLTHSLLPANHRANAVRIHWLFHKYFRHEEYPNIFLRWIWFICAIREEII